MSRDGDGVSSIYENPFILPIRISQIIKSVFSGFRHQKKMKKGQAVEEM